MDLLINFCLLLSSDRRGYSFPVKGCSFYPVVIVELVEKQIKIITLFNRKIQVKAAGQIIVHSLLEHNPSTSLGNFFNCLNALTCSPTFANSPALIYSKAGSNAECYCPSVNLLFKRNNSCTCISKIC